MLHGQALTQVLSNTTVLGDYIQTELYLISMLLAAGCRYHTDIQRARSLKDRQRQLISHLIEVSNQISEMAADDPWKLVQRIFEYGFFFNGLAQVCPPSTRAPGMHDESRLPLFLLDSLSY